MNEHDVVAFSLLFLGGVVMTLPVEAASRQGRFAFLYSLFKTNLKGYLLVIAAGVWQPHLVFLLGSLASASVHLQMAMQSFPADVRGDGERLAWRRAAGSELS